MNRRSFIQAASAALAAVAAAPKFLFGSVRPKPEMIRDEEFEVNILLDVVTTDMLETYLSINNARFKQWAAGTLYCKAWSMDRVWIPPKHIEGRNGSSSSSRAAGFLFRLTLVMVYCKEGWNRVYLVDGRERVSVNRQNPLPTLEGRWVHVPLYGTSSFAWLENAEISPRRKSSGSIVKPEMWGRVG